MSSKILRIAIAFFSSCPPFSIVFAARFSEFAHRKGHGPTLKSRMSEQPSEPQDSEQGHNFRFLSDETRRKSRFRIKSKDAECDLWGKANSAAFALKPCLNEYLITGSCPLLSDPLGNPTALQLSYPGLPVYFNRSVVKKAMHAPEDVEWLECCNGPVFVGDGGPQDEGDLSLDPIQSILPRVLEATHRVLIANADLDMSILMIGTLLAIQNMTRRGKPGFQEVPMTPIVITLPDLQYQALFETQGLGGIDNPQGTMVIQHFERGLMWVETFLSGHMQPQFQPRSSYRHLQWVLGHIDTL